MKNKRRIGVSLIIWCLLLTTLLPASYTLAQKDGGSYNKDRLCGLFVTIGYQDLPMNNLPIDDTAFSKASSNFFNIEDLSYRRIVEGISNKDGDIEFEGIKGYYMGESKIYDNEGNQISTGLHAKGYVDGKLSSSSMDDVDEETYEATLQFSSQFSDTANINPVYMREDGSYYTVFGEIMGYMFNGEIYEPGQIYSTTINNTFTSTLDGKSKSVKDNFILKFNVVNESNEIIIKEMNDKDEVIKITKYQEDDPNKFILDKETSYVIVESIANSTGDTIIDRRIYSMKKAKSNISPIYHPCNFAGEDGVIGTKSIEFSY